MRAEGIEALIYMEDNFEAEGRQDGYTEGLKQGEEIGYQLGLEKGFEFGKEFGFYQGFAELWIDNVSKDVENYPAKAGNSYRRS